MHQWLFLQDARMINLGMPFYFQIIDLLMVEKGLAILIPFRGVVCGYASFIGYDLTLQIILGLFVHVLNRVILLLLLILLLLIL